MSDILETVISKDEKEEIKEFISTILLLSREERAILLSNANAFRMRGEIEKAKNKAS